LKAGSDLALLEMLGRDALQPRGKVATGQSKDVGLSGMNPDFPLSDSELADYGDGFGSLF